MICQVCQDAAAQSRELPPDTPLEDIKALHKDCKGGTHCDCQHRPTVMRSDGSLAQRR